MPRQESRTVARVCLKELRAGVHQARRNAVARGDEQHKNPKSDIEIAQAAAMRPIGEVAGEKLGIPADVVLPYGRYKAKIPLDYIRSLRDRPNGRTTSAGMPSFSP